MEFCGSGVVDWRAWGSGRGLFDRLSGPVAPILSHLLMVGRVIGGREDRVSPESLA